MFGSKFIKWFLLSVFVVGLTACGGGSSSNDITSTPPPTPPSNVAPTADAGADQNVSLGDTVTLDGSGSTDPDGTIVAYEWKEGNTTLSTDVNFTKSDFSVGTHTLTLTVTDDDNATGTDDVNVTVVALPSNIAPTADAGADQNVSLGDTVTLDGSGSTDPDGTIVAYEWKEGNTTLSTDVNFTKSDFSVGTHILTLTVTDDDNATGTDDVNITVLSLIKKTGQTLSYDVNGDVNATIKDDGYYEAGRTPSYSRDDVNNTVTDNITMLMWQDDDNGTVGTGPSPTMNLADATTHCTDLTLGGYTDWRLPTIDELMYIADRSKANKAIDTTVFQNAVAQHYWSSSTASLVGWAWSVDFSNGNDNWDKIIDPLFVRCVRTLP